MEEKMSLRAGGWVAQGNERGRDGLGIQSPATPNHLGVVLAPPLGTQPSKSPFPALNRETTGQGGGWLQAPAQA